MKKLQWGIIGAGNIAGGYDIPEDERVLTHVKALKMSDSVGVIGVVEPNSKRLKAFCSNWDLDHGYRSIEELIQEIQPEAVSICTPLETHKSVIEKITNAGVKTILCEKPLAPTYAEAKVIAEQCQETGVKLVVNYLRRFDPGHIWAIDLVQNGMLGKIQKVSGYYCKGLLNSGCHVVNLSRAFFGAIKSVKNLGGPLSNSLPYNSPDFSTQHRDVSCVVRALDYRNFMLFEFDIIGEKGRISIREKGAIIEWYSVNTDPVFDDYKALRLEHRHEGTFDKLMRYVIETVAQMASGENKDSKVVLSMVDEAVDDLFWIEEIQNEK